MRIDQESPEPPDVIAHIAAFDTYPDSPYAASARHTFDLASNFQRPGQRAPRIF